MHSFHKVHNVGKAAVQCNDHAFGKLYISLTEADILPVLEEKNKTKESHTLEQSVPVSCIMYKAKCLYLMCTSSCT